jgi:hypothetical protein
MTTFNLRHAFRYPLPSRAGQARWLATLQPDAFAIRHGRASHQQNSLGRYSNLTLRITRPPTPSIELNNHRVAGRVHALVMRRPRFAEVRTSRNPSLLAGLIEATFPFVMPPHNAAHHAPPRTFAGA